MTYLIPKENRITPKAEIKSAKTHGKWLFAKEAISKWENVVIRWWNNYTNKAESDLAIKEGKLVMQRDDDLFSIEDRWDDDTYFINHSCNGNLRMEWPFNLVANRDIEKGEEITADYALWERDKNKISKRECHCGEKNCRKRFTGKDFMIKEVQERYKDHFSPLINKRINQL